MELSLTIVNLASLLARQVNWREYLLFPLGWAPSHYQLSKELHGDGQYGRQYTDDGAPYTQMVVRTGLDKDRRGDMQKTSTHNTKEYQQRFIGERKNKITEEHSARRSQRKKQQQQQVLHPRFVT